jgi:hypothetical protein
MPGPRERVLNAVFLNRGSIANAAAAVREGKSRERDRDSAARAVAISDTRIAAHGRRGQESRDAKQR